MLIADDMIIHGSRAILKSYAKINLTLDVLGKMENGYHEIESIMQTVNLFDLIIVDRTEFGITITTNLKFLPTNEKNIAYKAAEIFFEYTGISGGARILMHKNIPVAAGLAGGSGNGGGVIVALDALYNTKLKKEEILELAGKLGADVPYCTIGGTMLCNGIGEKLTAIPKLKKHIVLMVKPPVNISTKDIYDYIDTVEIKSRPDTNAMIDAIEKDNIDEIAENLSNVMEEATIRLHPVIGGIKKKMIMNGAKGALMSGSGSTVFGLFDDYDKAKSCHDSFAMFYKDVFLTHTI